ncbi:MAG: hypothetical protein HZA14_01725 [Nitrospirae bacterium]|nr:hypothetical protein [Nitrospirota bacterium]
MSQVCTIQDSPLRKIKIAESASALNAGIVVSSLIPQTLSDCITISIICFIAKVQHLPEIKKIAFKPKGNTVTIWTFIDEPSPKILKKIHSIEMEMMESMNDITFDFTTIFSSKEPSPTGFHEISLKS